MKVVNIQEAKTHLSRLVDAVNAGEEIIIAKHGKPMARLSAHSIRDEARPLGGFEGKITIADSFDDEDATIQQLFHGSS
jgi:prevent-host-death family protein